MSWVDPEREIKINRGTDELIPWVDHNLIQNWFIVGRDTFKSFAQGNGCAGCWKAKVLKDIRGDYKNIEVV